MGKSPSRGAIKLIHAMHIPPTGRLVIPRSFTQEADYAQTEAEMLMPRVELFDGVGVAFAVIGPFVAFPPGYGPPNWRTS